MERWIASVKEYLEVIGILAAWIYACWAWFNKQSKRRGREIEGRLKREIDGVGGKVNALVLTVGQHETQLDQHDTLLRTAAEERQRLIGDIAGFKVQVEGLVSKIDMREESSSKKLTDIQVDIGSLTSKVDIILRKMDL